MMVAEFAKQKSKSTKKAAARNGSQNKIDLIVGIVFLIACAILLIMTLVLFLSGNPYSA